jgi:hypothetical protein
VVSCRLSATGVRFSGHPHPARELSLPHGRPTAHRTRRRTRRGSHVPHSRDTTGLGAFSTPRTAVLTLDRMPCPASACRITTACPYTPLPHPTTELLFTRHQRRFTRFTRPVCPSPVTPRRDRDPSAFPSGFAPCRYQQRTPRAGPGIEHTPGTTQPTSRRPS